MFCAVVSGVDTSSTFTESDSFMTTMGGVLVLVASVLLSCLRLKPDVKERNCPESLWRLGKIGCKFQMSNDNVPWRGMGERE